ncbi:Asp-tRNA(Asn)/Glu-tRNA(Gln) amidotransferase subunit GatC [Spongiibacter marinus]|jgi:aspartyl-tRNA(Asn)/glutamyl-tRNA(Gln) amidotransferase subunit C|uniref:Asp-tRNA(Asn)/Glu-tRNA(Gln) amidotransferase subunit GatC n=1 Tax=Spongiibacter marinus TaxID=354246 RepID=UPI0019611976|nr:Asp-tRNA(Asn)/Glu-tRNA(Gln) amidotransferase subunit GatC [Spongiibacter marinus]MBM7424730.1 aspartyl-tRNA(Asn)/glutamyl-tRNA(Gln) amidotransferase subunit C [Spongiibacter marinus]
MSLEQGDIAKLARLARIRISEESSEELRQRISDILGMIDTMQAVNTDAVDPMANPHDATQRLRADVVTEVDQRDDFQRIAPATEDGLYLVPKVID